MYAKLFSRIAQSSLMEQRVTTRYVFMMTLALADRHGDVIGTDVAIARMMNVPLDEFLAALKPLLEPDHDSNSQAEEGRRIIPSDNGRGYKVVNYREYRDMKSDDEKREYMRQYMRKRRENLGAIKDVNACKPCKDLSTDVTQADAEAEADSFPPTPKGALRNRKRKSDPKLERVTENTPTMIRVNEWFGRRPETLWTLADSYAMESINPSEPELDGMEAFYLADDDPANPLHRRTNLSTLLNNWHSELDKARGYARRKRGAA